MTTLLVLGGSGMARRATDALAVCLEEHELEVRIVYALAGATRSPRVPNANIEVRSGGFGGAKGLQKWLQDNKVAALVDATHPFAEQISENARQAARALNLPLFRLLSRPFPRLYTKKRFEIFSSETLSETLPRLLASLPSSYRRSVLCALGAQRIVALARRLPVRRLWLRSFASAQRQRNLRLQNLRLRRARCVDFCAMPPFSAQSVRQEMRWMRRKGISLLLCRDSGAREAFVKILAAQKLSLPVVVIARPRSAYRFSYPFAYPLDSAATTNLSARDLSPRDLSPRDLSPVARLLQQQSRSTS